ncbi:hypothetical protein N7519_007812 [Penicillium mononematosum]|uniref:uncharacterized protein n=1 Tax=Penicillium mononematosum TaxID=268346 RepID=UPI0025497DA9|nr:uncharacterized protein N7519_007812 [Penicillium mononematosum]KAJ6186511.1 hypothetical protein N7519_007812 [Penicillium mononematosum]
MPFEYQNEGKFHRVPKLEGAPACVYFTWRMAHANNLQATSFRHPPGMLLTPLTGSMFYLKYDENPQPAPPYHDFEETGVLLRGELHLKDEAGKTAVLLPGDTFFIQRKSTITFSTPRYAVAYKVASRHRM